MIYFDYFYPKVLLINGLSCPKIHYFDLSDPKKVVVKIAGRIWDENYTKLLMSKTDFDLKTVVLLDRVQKFLPITDDEIKL